ncbi:hypothetical protein B484DRAFT_442023 [Ochromonadaceae sp. CCMP2298]|nr:hypothetical protein B484DRAFT_442023 [Ochromonadaceae sp. CCMP2298]
MREMTESGGGVTGRGVGRGVGAGMAGGFDSEMGTGEQEQQQHELEGLGEQEHQQWQWEGQYEQYQQELERGKVEDRYVQQPQMWAIDQEQAREQEEQGQEQESDAHRQLRVSLFKINKGDRNDQQWASAVAFLSKRGVDIAALGVIHAGEREGECYPQRQGQAQGQTQGQGWEKGGLGGQGGRARAVPPGCSMVQCTKTPTKPKTQKSAQARERETMIRGRAKARMQVHRLHQ